MTEPTKNLVQQAFAGVGQPEEVTAATKIYRATLETRHFTFDTYGRSEKEARSLMEKAWDIHAKQSVIAHGQYTR